MSKLLNAVLGSVLTLLIVFGGPTVWWYTYRFDGYHWAGVTVFHIGAFTLKPGAGVQLAALRGRFQQCRANEATLTDALSRQNAAVVAVAAEGARRTAAADQAVQRARSATAAAYRRASAIMAAQPAVGEDRCKAADELIIKMAGAE